MYALCTPSICVFIMFKYRLSVKSSLVDILVFKAMGFFFFFFLKFFFPFFSHFLGGGGCDSDRRDCQRVGDEHGEFGGFSLVS